jgi:hypothetical protein
MRFSSFPQFTTTQLQLLHAHKRQEEDKKAIFIFIGKLLVQENISLNIFLLDSVPFTMGRIYLPYAVLATMNIIVATNRMHLL